MRRTGPLLVIAGAMFSTAGCANYSGPRWFNPGPVAYQRAEAERYDPYPDPNMGPEIIGGRPLSYEHPAPEPERGRWNPFTLGR